MPVHGLKSPGNDEACTAGVWTCASPHGQLVLPYARPRSEKLACMQGARAELSATGLGVTATDQGDAIRVTDALGVHCLTLMEYIEAQGPF